MFFTDTESPAGQGEDDFVGVPVPRQELILARTSACTSNCP